MIPERFQATCTFCHDPLDIRKAGIFQLTYGWVKNRKEGGGNAIALAEKQPHWACTHCIEAKSRGHAQYQLDLFA